MNPLEISDLTIQRLEERPPGDGVPAGWLPDTLYHVKAVNIPYRVESPEATIPFIPKGSYLIRRLSVHPECVDDWELAVRVRMVSGFRLLRPRTSARLFGEDPFWPFEPEMVRKGETIVLTLWRRPLSVSKRFECIFRGAEDSVLPKGEERSIMMNGKTS